jgi:hypothetical protein
MLTMSTASCATVEQRLTTAATVKGTVDAGANLPDQPTDCRKQEAHAEVAAGAEVRSVLIRERAALDRQNARGGRCADFYDDVKSRFASRDRS